MSILKKKSLDPYHDPDSKQTLCAYRQTDGRTPGAQLYSTQTGLHSCQVL